MLARPFQAPGLLAQLTPGRLTPRANARQLAEQEPRGQVAEISRSLAER